MTERERRLLQDKAYAAYSRLNRAIQTHDPQARIELLEEHATITEYVLKAIKPSPRSPSTS